MKLTAEQESIAGYEGNLLAVSAFAGTGKTHTLVEYALRNPNDRILYLGFNKAICEEAKNKFPRNVEVRTSHSIAYQRYGRKLRHKLSPSLRLTHITDELGYRDWGLASELRKKLNDFMASEDMELTLNVDEEQLKHTLEGQEFLRLEQAKLDLAKVLWEKMIDPNSAFPCTHDAYLKLYQISEPELHKQYDTILFDEAQDANPATSHIVLNQQCKKILVGDPHQQIYGFRGADDALNHPLLKDADRLSLTNSWRFGPNVAEAANEVLFAKNEPLQVKGLGAVDEVTTNLDRRFNNNLTVLHRTRAGTIASAVSYMQTGQSVYWIGGINSYGLDALIDLYYLQEHNLKEIKDRKLVKDFPTWMHYEQAAEEAQDVEMLSSIRMVTELIDFPNIAARLRQNAVMKESESDVVVGTAHRSKGLEWPVVALYDDFSELANDDGLIGEIKETEEELNLLYVAITRAEKLLYMPEEIEETIAKVTPLLRKARQEAAEQNKKTTAALDVLRQASTDTDHDHDL